MSSDLPLIKVVGISAAGKSTLVEALRQQGYNARSASQEHSQTPDMWQRIRPPALLIYLHIDLETQQARRPDVAWNEMWLGIEEERLAHARSHADLELNTVSLTPQEVVGRVLAFLREKQIASADHPLPPAPGTGGSLRDEPSAGEDSS